MHLGERFYTEEELSEAGFRRLGSNVKIKRNAGLFFTENISIGDNTRIDDFTIIVASREPVTIGRNVHIAAHCYISGSDGFTMEDFCTFAPGVKVFTSSDDYAGEKMTNVTLPRKYMGGAGPIHLGRHVIIGAGSVVLPSVAIGEGSSVGALSLVSHSLERWGIYCGIPAKRLRERSRNLQDILRTTTEYRHGSAGPKRWHAPEM
jgi:acetyltransferase-like isoleucine patch superfamily enzyme